MQELLRDSRMALRHIELKEMWVEEQHWLHALPMSVWVRLVSNFLEHMSASDFRDDVIQALTRAHGHLQYRLWSVLERSPWNLLIGDMASNLGALVSLSEPPPCEVARKLWALYRSGSLPEICHQMRLRIHPVGLSFFVSTLKTPACPHPKFITCNFIKNA